MGTTSPPRSIYDFDFKWINYWALGDLFSGPFEFVASTINWPADDISTCPIISSLCRNFETTKTWHSVTSLSEMKMAEQGDTIFSSYGIPFIELVKPDVVSVIEADFDGDGFQHYRDCDDSNPSINPGAPEVCGDGIDNNCDGQVNEGCGDLTSGLGAYYPFNGNANDESGNGNNGTAYGATPTTDRFGNANRAYRFSGSSSSYIRVPRSSSLEPQKALTISFWMLRRGSGTYNQAVLRKAANCSAGYIIWGTLSMKVDGPSACAGQGIGVYIDTSSYLNMWDHYVMSYDTTTGLKFYRNGILRGSTVPLAPTMSHSGDLYIGGAVVHRDDGGLNGDLDDIRIYNRALSESEIQQLYQSGQ